MFSFGNIHGDTDVLADFTSRIVMSHGTQESDGAVWTKNPIFEVIVHSCLDSTIKFLPQSGLIFRVSGAVQAFEWDRAVAGIEAIEAKNFI